MYIEILLLGIMVLASGILNRLRGTGLVKDFGVITLPYVYKTPIKVNLVWNHIYGLYIGILVGILSMNIWYGLIALVLYIVGESKGWGEWIGTLTRYEPITEEILLKNYNDNEGKKFPFIHQIANFFIKEELKNDTFTNKVKQYMKYASLALILRGIYWWLPLYLLLAWLEITSYSDAFIGALFIGVMFPINCLLSKYITYDGRILGVVQFGRGWENQEFLNGMTQGMVLWLLISGILN